jgi:hypothetical protein
MLLKGNRLQDMDKIKHNTMTWLLAFPKSQFHNASYSERTAGTSVLCVKGPTLKGSWTAM